VAAVEAVAAEVAPTGEALPKADAGETEAATFGADTKGVRPQVVSRARRWWLAAGVGALVLAAAAGALWLRPAPPPAPAPTPQLAPFGVAVLPVSNLSGDAADQPLADGLTEQITHALSQNGYPVVARTTTEQWRGRAADVRQLGEQLGVSHVLEGSVRRSGERVRVTMQLVETDAGRHVWSEEFDEPLADPLALQSRIGGRVAVQIFGYVGEDTIALKRNPEAKQLAALWAEARARFFEGRFAEHVALGERLLAALPEREPFLLWRGLTNAMMSYAQANLYVEGVAPLAEAGPEFLARAEAGVALAPEFPNTHVALARAYTHYWRWEEAEAERRQTCALAPAGTQCAMATYHLCLSRGCVNEGLDAARRWHQQVPADPTAWGAVQAALLLNDRLEEAESVALRERELFPTGGTFLRTIQWRLGRRDESVETLRRMLEARGMREPVREIDERRAAGPEAVNRWRAEQLAAGELELLPPNLDSFFAAQTFAELGDFDAALRELERSVAEHEAGMEYYGLDPIFDPIRDTERFRALIERMGLTAYHEKYGVFERARRRVAAAAGNNEPAP
jgi:TolB-like protein